MPFAAIHPFIAAAATARGPMPLPEPEAPLEPPPPEPAATPAFNPAGALRRAVVHCGGQSALASAIGVSQSHVWNWLSRRRVPAEHCPAIERATARAVRCEELRPDVDWAYLRAVCEELAQGA